MASLVDLFFQPGQTPPALRQSDAQIARDQAITDARTQQGILSRLFRTRQVPGIVNRRAARGGFFAGGTAKELGFAAEDVQQQIGQIESNLQRTLLDIVRNLYAESLGQPLSIGMPSGVGGGGGVAQPQPQPWTPGTGFPGGPPIPGVRPQPWISGPGFPGGPPIPGVQPQPQSQSPDLGLVPLPTYGIPTPPFRFLTP